MRLLPSDQQAEAGRQEKGPATTTTAHGPRAEGRGRAKPIAGLAYLFDNDAEQKQEQVTKKRQPSKKERKKARRIDYDLLTAPDGLPTLYNRMQTFRLDESQSIIGQLEQLIAPYREWAKDLMPNYTFDDFIDRTEKLSGTYTVKGMLDSLQHGEGFPTQEEILRKRPAKIDEKVEAALDPLQQQEEEEEDDRRAWEAERKQDKPDLDYRPEQRAHGETHFLADDDEIEDHRSKPKSAPLDRKSSARTVVPTDDFNLEDLLAQDGHKALQEQEEYEQRLLKQKELHQQWLEEKAEEEERLHKRKEKQRKERERKKKEEEEERKAKSKRRRQRHSSDEESDSIDSESDSDGKKKSKSKKRQKSRKMKRKTRDSSSEPETSSDSDASAKGKRSQRVARKESGDVSSDEDEKETKEQTKKSESKPAVIRRVARRRGINVTADASKASSASISGTKRKNAEDDDVPSPEDDSKSSKRRRINDDATSAKEVDDIPLAELLGLK